MRLPITYDALLNRVTNADDHELESFYSPVDRIRQIERASIRKWMEEHVQYLKGRVLDFGCGKQPYKDLILGEYFPVEKGGYISREKPFDAIMCNQVVQYLHHGELQFLLELLHEVLRVDGHLLVTFPTNWDVCEPDIDLCRFTQTGMQKLLESIGFKFVSSDLRATVVLGNFQFQLGYGMVVQRT